MNAVNWFEIPAVDLGRAKVFYEAVFAVSLAHMDMGPSAMEMFPTEPGAPNAGGALIVTEGYTPSATGTTVYFQTDDIDGTLARVTAAGGSILAPKMAIGEHGFIAQFLDSEGNRVALHSMQ
ncbi:MAG: VOC family protein [Acidobacteria bacterium]|nr:VOC family protein [Acidobacteriota bacterium]